MSLIIKAITHLSIFKSILSYLEMASKVNNSGPDRLQKQHSCIPKSLWALRKRPKRPTIISQFLSFQQEGNKVVCWCVCTYKRRDWFWLIWLPSTNAFDWKDVWKIIKWTLPLTNVIRGNNTSIGADISLPLTVPQNLASLDRLPHLPGCNVSDSFDTEININSHDGLH